MKMDFRILGKSFQILLRLSSPSKFEFWILNLDVKNFVLYSPFMYTKKSPDDHRKSVIHFPKFRK